MRSARRPAVAVSPDGARVYATNFGSGTVPSIETEDHTVTNTVKLPGSSRSPPASP